jgi:hypothetical protein
LADQGAPPELVVVGAGDGGGRGMGGANRCSPALQPPLFPSSSSEIGVPGGAGAARGGG